VDKCRIYTDKTEEGSSELKGECFECERIGNELYGAILISDPDNTNSKYIC
jgi:hypothetical protein